MRHTATEVYLTEKEFCEKHSLSPRTAQRWRVTGHGPKWVRLGLRQVRYRVSDCEAWAASQTYQSRAAEITKQIAA